MIDIDPADTQAFVERFNAIPETIRTRVLW